MDAAKRGGQKKGTRQGSESRQHQGVHPGSTTQKKAQRQKAAEKRPNQGRVVNEK